MKIIVKFLFVGIACSMFSVGCGQKGDLYLPVPEADKKEAVTIQSDDTTKLIPQKTGPKKAKPQKIK